jgi:hypothetical protein
MSNILRWALVPVAVAVVYPAVFILGVSAMTMLDIFCPSDQIVSDHCVAPWYLRTTDTLIVACAGASAFGVVLVPAFVAPAGRFLIAVCGYIFGGVYVVYLANISSSFRNPCLVAAVSGTLALGWAWRRWRSHVVAA